MKDSRDNGGVSIRTIQSVGAVGLRLGWISASDSLLQMRRYNPDMTVE